jgi:Tfp pilus assembly protein PilF
LLLLLAALPLFTNCATGKDPGIQYGNPQYTHVRELPQNQAAAWEARQVPEPKLPETTDGELEAMGDARLGQGDYLQAYLNYADALKKNPANRRAPFKIGLTYLLAGKLDDARAQFEQVTRADPENAAAWEGLGMVCFQKRDHAAAESHFTKALSLDPALWQAHAHLGYIRDARKDHAAAASCYLSALAIQPRNGALYNDLGASYSLAGRYPEAVEAFKSALAHNYTTRKVYNNLGLALAHNGKFDEALAAFTRGVGKPMAYANLGTFHYINGQYAESARCYQQAIALDPGIDSRVRDHLKLAQARQAGAAQ